jgi:hypothetical protein
MFMYAVNVMFVCHDFDSLMLLFLMGSPDPAFSWVLASLVQVRLVFK